jgi:hypothetical protein
MFKLGKRAVKTFYICRKINLHLLVYITFPSMNLYRLHLCTTGSNHFILCLHSSGTVNGNDAAIMSKLFSSIKNGRLNFLLEMPPMTVKQSVKSLNKQESPINSRGNEERKDAYGRVIPLFLKTESSHFCNSIEQTSIG